MRIAQVSPLMEAVPPRLYGGTERIVSYLTDELVALGHDVTLFASGDSITRARLEPVWPQALRLDGSMREHMAPLVMMMETLARRAEDFDILHLHIDYIGYPLMRRLGVPFLSTLHGRLDLRELQSLYRLFDEVPVVSISNAQREPLPEANYVATVYHGLPKELLRPGPGTGGYLAFLGRVSPEKAPDAAVRIAARAGLPLKVAAKVDEVDQAYYEERIEALFRQPHVEFIGEITEGEKSAFLGQAAGLLFPIAWREPFGLAVIEAMACGTPVIAFRNGSIPEIIDHGVTGFIVENEDEAVAAVGRLPELDRAKIRQVFERCFTARRMAKEYSTVYHRLIAQDHALRRVV